MQHPVGYALGPNGEIAAGELLGLAAQSLGALAVCAQHDRRGGHRQLRDGRESARFICSPSATKHYGRTFVRLGVIVGVIASVLQLFPPGDAQGSWSRAISPPRWRPWKDLFKTQEGAPVAILGQPDVQNQRLDNPLLIPER